MDLSILPKLAGLLIPLFAIAVPVLVVALVLHFRQRQREALYQTVKHFADRGMPVPRELLDPPASGPRAVTPRFWALTAIGAGVGVALMFWFLELPNLLGIGGLLVCIGIAQWIALALDARERPVSPPPPQA